MRTLDRLSELASKVISKFSLKQFVDINEQPLFRMPNYMFRLRYWLGALVAAAFIYEVVTGLFLLLNYYPSNPYSQTQYLINKIPFGAPILYSHLYGAYFMIFLAYIHLFRNYFDGAYKKPRQLLWVVGILLFAITLGTAFTGYSLPADILGADADGVAQGIVAGAPGGALINTILFGNGLSLDMYTRFLGWHIILTAILGALVGLHFMLFEQYGVMPSKKVMEKAPAVYPKEEWEKFNPWFPRNFVYTLELTLFIWGLILIVPNVIINIHNIPNSISPLFSPAPLVSPSGTLPPGTPAFPPWFFLFLYKAIDFLQPNGAPYTPFMASLLAGLLPALYLLLLPWLDRSAETAAHKRTLFAGIGILLITYLVQLSVWGAIQPGIPEPFSTQVGVMLPPIFIAFVSLYLIPRAIHSKKGERTLTPKNAALLTVVGLVIVGTWSNLMKEMSIYLLGVFIPIALSLLLFATRFSRGVEESPQTVKEPKILSYNIAIVFMVLLFVVAAGILALLIRLPVTGPESSYWGIGAGIILLIFSYALSLYGYLYYPQENDEVKIVPKSEGRAFRRRMEVSGSSGEDYSPETNASPMSVDPEKNE